MSRQNFVKNIEIQKTIDECMRIQGQLSQIESKIEQRQLEYFSNCWSEQAFSSLWAKPEHSNFKKSVIIQPKDRKFSLTSIFSRPSMELLNIEDQKMILGDKLKFQKKKKSRKGKFKGKTIKKKKVNKRNR